MKRIGLFILFVSLIFIVGCAMLTPGSSKQEFLRTLRLWPDHLKAGKMLRAKQQSVKAKKFIVHTIKPEESLSKLAMIYYGDYFKFSIIAEYNNLTDATHVRVGQKIKVPEIEGVPFFPPKQDVESERVQVVKKVEREEDQWVEKAIERPVKQTEAAEKEAAEQEIEEIEEPFDAVASYRYLGIELFNQDKYRKAIVEFNKVVKENPDDEVAVEYLYKAYFKQGMGLFEKEDYLSAKEEFEASLRFNGGCLKCREYIKKSEDIYKEIHYKRGVAYFGKELLNKAVREWEMVHAVDPNYKKVKHNINKAKTLLKRLKEIKEHTDKSR